MSRSFACFSRHLFDLRPRFHGIPYSLPGCVARWYQASYKKGFWCFLNNLVRACCPKRRNPATNGFCFVSLVLQPVTWMSFGLWTTCHKSLKRSQVLSLGQAGPLPRQEHLWPKLCHPLWGLLAGHFSLEVFDGVDHKWLRMHEFEGKQRMLEVHSLHKAKKVSNQLFMGWKSGVLQPGIYSAVQEQGRLDSPSHETWRCLKKDVTIWAPSTLLWRETVVQWSLTVDSFFCGDRTSLKAGGTKTTSLGIARFQRQVKALLEDGLDH